jgi:hypothetical protein
VRTTKWECLYPVDPRVLVVSQPCTTLNELARQKQRWGKGGLDMKPSGLLIMTIGFCTHAFTLLTALLGSFFIAATALLLKSAADYFFLHTILTRLERTDLLKHFYWFELYFFCYVLLLPFMVFLGGKVIWKGRAY